MTFHVDDHDARNQHENGGDDELSLPRDEHGGLQMYDLGRVSLGKFKKNCHSNFKQVSKYR